MAESKHRQMCEKIIKLFITEVIFETMVDSNAAAAV